MSFWLKKSISYWLMPLPACVALLVVACIASRFARSAGLGRRFLLAATALLLVFGNISISKKLAGPLEAQYPGMPEIHSPADVPAKLGGCEFIVVLGGGNGEAPGLAATNKLSSSALGRIVECVRLARLLPAAQLILSGPGNGHDPTHASVLAEAAVSLGIDRSRIRLIEDAHDTEQEARAVKGIVGEARVALVTSAWHMPRAAALFRSDRIAAVPCPADYSVKRNPEGGALELGWDVEALMRSTEAVHEGLGLLWLKLRGKI